MNIVETLLKKDIFKDGDRLGVALSGGVDSVALLLVLMEVKKAIDIDVFAIHINHSIREVSVDEARFVKNLTNSLGVDCLFFTLDKSIYKKDGASMEEIARRARYEIFARIATERGACIALGHHRQDQGETVFMHILRGTALGGLIGMKEVNGIYIRPLLDFTKDDLESFLREKSIGNVTDESNFDEKYTRNKIRGNIFPYIEKEMDVDLGEKLASMSKILSDDEDFLNDYARTKFYDLLDKDEEDRLCFRIDDIRTLPVAIARRVFRMAIAHFHPSLKDVSFNAIEQIFGILDSENGSLNLPEGILVKRVYEYLEFNLDRESKNLSAFLINKDELGEGINRFGDFELEIMDKSDLPDDFDYFSKNPFKKCFDYGKFKRTIFIRPRSEGDFITIKGGKKSIKKFFIDEKVREDERDEIYLLGSDSDVAWIVGYRIAERYKISEDTKKILIVEYKGDVNG